MEDLDRIGQEYAVYAKMHGGASRNSDHRQANAAYEGLAKAYLRLRAAGRDGECVLQALMEHEDPSVRLWAATHCLPFAEREAKAVLARLRDATGIVSLDAGLVLEAWSKGELQDEFRSSADTHT